MAITILIVDDSITMLSSVKSALTMGGYTVETANSGQAALDKLMGGLKPNLIITDINMPKMDGYEMIRLVRGDPGLQSVPVVAISTEAADGDITRAYEAGANFYMVKPVNPGELAETARLLTGVRAP